MRWVGALAILLVVLVGATVKVATRGRDVHGPKLAPEMPEPPPLAPRPRIDPPRSRPRAEPRGRIGIAHVRGSVRLPPGAPTTDGGFDDLEVVADDGTRVFNARLAGAGRFAFHLPPGRYDIVATLDDLVGHAAVVLAHAGAERDVDIQLGAAATIAGRLRASGHRGVEIQAKAVGSANVVTASAGGDTFEVSGLVPGLRYDLSFRGSKVRAATLREIVAPAKDLEVTLEPLAVIRGAVGFARGERCPVTEVRLQNLPRAPREDEEVDEDGTSMHTGADCKFELTVPENVSVASVAAEGPGWFLEEQVDIPAMGDPAPICLNPPCRDNPTEGLARLRVTLEGATPESVITADVMATGSHGSEHHSCSSEQGWCMLEDLPVGGSFRVQGYGDDCHAEARTITLASGDNSVRLACRRQRRVEGIVRQADGLLPEAVIVRCASGGFRTLHNTRVFELRCGTEDSTLEFQLARGEPWRSVPLPPASDPAFVEIGL